MFLSLYVSASLKRGDFALNKMQKRLHMQKSFFYAPDSMNCYEAYPSIFQQPFKDSLFSSGSAQNCVASSV